jgi:hypothetical protein
MCQLVEVVYGPCGHNGRYIYFCVPSDTPCKNLELMPVISTPWAHCSEDCCLRVRQRIRRQLFAIKNDAQEALRDLRRHGGWWNPAAQKLSKARQDALAMEKNLSSIRMDCDRWCNRDIFLYESSQMIENRPIAVAVTDSDGYVQGTPAGEDVSYRMLKTIQLIKPDLFKLWMPKAEFYGARRRDDD